MLLTSRDDVQRECDSRAQNCDGGKAELRELVMDFDRVGLCLTCAHARIVASSKGSSFYLCRKADTDARFAKYPALPVRECPGYEPTAGTFDTAEEPPSEYDPWPHRESRKKI
jgi:hypothetical protein